MSEGLLSLQHHCDQLDSDKVTERKKHIESFKRELNRNVIVQQLDHNSNNGRGLTWNAVFNSLISYMLKEIDHLKKQKGESSTSLSSKDRKKQTVGEVFKWFVRKANQRGEKLNCSDLLHHVLTLMKDDFLGIAFGEVCCSVILKDILRSRKYFCQISSSNWQELLKYFCKALRDPVQRTSHDVLSRIVRLILAGALKQSNVSTSFILTFFNSIINKFRTSERSATVVENILGSLNLFILTCASDLRTQLCKLGEDSIDNLLHVWKKYSTPAVKEEVVVFLRMQMALHHPKGVVTEEQGAYAEDFTVWRGHLKYLYDELVYNEWTKVNTRRKLKGVIGREIFKETDVDLAAEICHQILCWSDSTAGDITPGINPDLNQSSNSSRYISQGQSAAKRRKVDSSECSWEILLDMISIQTSNLIPWLQLIQLVLHKYPNSLPLDQLLPLISKLHQVQTESKRAEEQTWLLKTLQALAVCQFKLSNLPTELVTALQTEWNKIWSCAIRTISLHSAECDGFDLLTSMLHYGIVNPDKEHWRLFMADSTQPTRSSVQFLAMYLSHHSLPENYTCKPGGILVSESAAVKGIYPLRHQLLNWLLPIEEQDEPGERLIMTLLKSLPTTLVAKVLGKLTQRTTQCRPQDTTHNNPPDPTRSKTEQTLQDVETLYLQSSFNKLVWQVTEDRCLSESDVKGGSASVVISVKQSLMKTLEVIGIQVLDFSSNEVSCFEALIHYASFLCKTLSWLIQLGVLSNQEIAQSKVTDSLKTLLKRVSVALRTLWHKNESDNKVRIQSLESLIMTLDDMLTWDHSSSGQMVQDSAQWLADTCRRSTPRELIDLLFEIIRKKGTNAVTNKSGPPKMAAKDPFGDDLMDTEFDDDLSDTTHDEVDSFDVNSNLPDETAIQKDNLSLLSSDSLSEYGQLALKAAKCLCSWSLTGGGKLSQEKEIARSALGPFSVQEKLLDLFEQDVWDPSSAFDVQLYFLVADAFIACDERPDDAHINGLLYALKTVVSSHRKDHALCAAAFSLFSRLIPCLDCDTAEVSQTLRQARDVALRLINAIWKLQRDFTPPERLAIAKCIHALVLIDPMGKWTILRSKVKESGQGDNDLSAHSVMYMLVRDGGSHTVRMYMAVAIKCLFCHPSKDGTVSTPFTKEIQNQAFDMVYQAAQDAMDIKGRLKTQDQAEQSANHTASLLATLSTMARYSPACEKKTVFALMQIVTLNGINIPLMNKVLHSISDSLQYTSVTVFMETHLSFLLYQWLLEKYLLTQFPYQLLGCQTEQEFYRRYHQVVIPHLVTMESINTVKDIAKSLDTDWTQLLKDSFPQTIAHILPLFAHTGAAEEGIGSEDYQERRSGAIKGLEALEGTLGKEAIDSMIQVNLDQIVVELLAMLYEPHSVGSRDGTQFTSDRDPEPNPPFFTSYTIKATLDYLTTCHAGSKALTLVTLLAKTQDNIQKILLSLHIKISKSHRYHEKQRILLAYRLFISLLLAELPTGGLGGSWAMVLQDVIYTLVHSLQEGQELGKGLELGEGGRLCGLCVDLLHDVCVTALKCCAEELGKHLCVMIGALVPLMETDDAVANQALSLINLLVIDNVDKLAPALKLLDPFPGSAKLAPARTAQQAVKYEAGEFTLMEEVQHFLLVGKQGGVLRLEGLRHLHHQLATKKEELAIMVQQCTEGCDRTIIHLLTELVKISGAGDHVLGSKGDVLQSLKEEAGRCLGDIGAPNLSTVGLHCDEAENVASYTTALKVFAKDPIMSRHVVIIHLLQQYLSDPNVDIVEAAANCLKTVLATNSGQRCHEKCKEKNIDKLFGYLEPFRPSNRKITHKPALPPSAASFEKTIGDPLLWQPVSSNHGDWVRNLTVALIRSGGVKDEILLQLQPICTVKVEFAERVLPYVFHDILSLGIDRFRQVLSHGVETVFSSHCQSNSRAPTPVPFHDASSSQLGQRSIHTLLDVMYYLRTQERPKGGRSKSTAWDNNFWLDVNYLLAAKAAQNCRAHFTCLLYTEIWCDVQRSQQGSIGSSRPSSQSLNQPSDIESLSVLSDESHINIQSLLLEAYSSIGEPDGVYGCGAGRLTDTCARIHTYEHEGDWDKALSAYDLKLHSKSTHTGQEEIGILQAMQNKGLSHILNVYLHGLRSEQVVIGPEMAEFQYEAAWRNGQWDQELDHSHQTQSTGYHQSIFTALSCLRDDEEESFQMALQHARLDTVKQLCNVSMESAYSVYPMLSRLQGLTEMEDFGSVLLENSQPMSVLHSWSSQLTLMDNDFEFCEPTLALRTVLLQLLLERNNETSYIQQAYEGLVTHLKNYTQLARKAERFQIAEKALATLQCLDRPSDVQSDPSWWRLIEEAKVYWTRNEKTTAMHLIKALLDKINRIHTQDPVAESLHPEVLTIFGNWLADTCSESPNVIIDKYMEKAVDIYDARSDTSAPAINAHLSLARFADSQYQNIVNYTKSSEYEAKENLLKRAKRDCEELKAIGGKSSSSDSKYLRTLHKQSEIDELELGSMMEDRENFLQKAIECYLKCLQHGSQDHDMRVFRVCSLWFDNSSDDYLNQLIQESCERIESRKFLPMLYQLAARMTTKTQDKQLFHEVLNELIEKMARDHPHHALPIILALANANKDALITASKTTGRLARTPSSVKDSDTSHADQARMQAAKGMLERLRSTPSIRDILAGLERLSDAYIELAYWDVSDRKRETGAIRLPSTQPLTQLEHLQHVAMPTMEVPIDANCRYDNITSIEGFEGTFKLAGGINLPKIITCIGSDGIKRRQLVKGKDDLRQDAVMQQVFSLVNKLLQRNQETRKRRLQIRTYKIVPLSQRSGLLEWCEGTMPIGQYLIGNQRTDFGAHKRYRPQDWTSMECRSKMAQAHKSSEQGKKYREYLAVMAHFKPVFRHFFLEKFPDPAVWLERRLAYTRSVATSSIVGYVVGLGDRHVQNILVDCNLAELVHIDLGVAFEQGRILPTPETIPFRLTRDLVDGMGIAGVEGVFRRLTRDLVDGMGIAGVEGVFRRCCEKTMDVMHNSQEALLTILQVLLYDPLYIWTMSPHKAIALQQRRDRNDPDASDLNTTATDLPDGETTFKGQDSNDGSEVNKVAERVVLRLRQKLQGVEEGVAMSVKGQVNRLIQEATDSKNLCRVFPGWQPWL